MNRIKQISIFLLAFGFLFSACNSDEDNVNPGTAPTLPPAGSMEIDFSNFTDGSSSGGREMTSDHWNAAALTVGVWNTVLTVGLIVPVASFKAAVSQKPVYDPDRGVWVWDFDHNVVGRTFSFELTGKVAGDNVEWNMYASEEGGFQDVLWYSGVTAVDGSSGYWLLNKDGNNPTEFLKIEWEQSNDEVAYIKYTNIEEASDTFGAYIEYGKTDGADFDRYYNIIGTDGSVKIEWNDTTGAGHLQVNDGAYSCWDSTFQDIDC